MQQTAASVGCALVSLGANLGEPNETLTSVLNRLDESSEIAVVSRSTFYATDPVGGPANQPPFVNAAVVLQTTLTAERLHEALLAIEISMGRMRRQTWEARTCDLDLLLYDQQILDSPELVVPHPRMAARSFVLEPAAEIASDWIHPRIGSSLGELWHTWQHGSRAVALLGDEQQRSWLRDLIRRANPPVQFLDPVERIIGSRKMELLATESVSAVDFPAKLALATNWSDSELGLPTLVVSPDDEEMALRAAAAALTDALGST